jgi:carbon-monoxide dehydrogenase medium subunit
VGGTVIAAGASRLACALLALDAQVIIFDGQERRLSLAAFYAHGARIEDGLLTEVIIPQPAPGTGVAHHEVARSPADSPVVSVTALLSVAGEVCQKARVVAGGAGLPAVRLVRAEEVLEGQTLSEDLIARAAEAAREVVTPVDDFRASGEYRKAMVGVLACRALREAWENADAQDSRI